MDKMELFNIAYHAQEAWYNALIEHYNEDIILLLFAGFETLQKMIIKNGWHEEFNTYALERWAVDLREE